MNSCSFMPYTNTVLTSSADKTVSLWDARTVSSGLIYEEEVEEEDKVVFV